MSGMDARPDGRSDGYHRVAETLKKMLMRFDDEDADVVASGCCLLLMIYINK